MRLYIYIRFIFKKYYFIDLCYILNWFGFESEKFINISCLLIYRIFISKVFSIFFFANHKYSKRTEH